jgi:hypothetical protein
MAPARKRKSQGEQDKKLFLNILKVVIPTINLVIGVFIVGLLLYNTGLLKAIQLVMEKHQ